MPLDERLHAPSGLMTAASLPADPVPLPPQGAVDALPESLRLLCLCDESPSWIGLSLELDRGGCHAPRFQHAATTAAALAALREDSFDAVLVVEPSAATFDPRAIAGRLGALRAGLVEDPLLVVVPVSDDELAVAACRHDADVIVTGRPWSCRALVPTLRRALERHGVVQEHRRLVTEQRRRLDRDRSEAERLLRQQRSIIAGLGEDGSAVERPGSGLDVEGLRSHGARPPSTVALPAAVAAFYDDLLRTHVIMGSGRLSDEISQLGEMLATAGIGPREALGLHLERVAVLIRGLGNRSTRHVVARADLLALELVVHLGECYRDAANA